MEQHTVTGLLALGLALGLLHAFDADHIVAVSSLASREPDHRQGLRYAATWALGHGGILLLVAIAALWFRWQVPEAVGRLAEKSVGAILIVAGLSMLWTLYRQRIGLSLHRHGDVAHAHLTTRGARRHHDHAPLLVGMVHGLAGSAPALSLIPAVLVRPSLGLAYVLVFSAGVLASMVGFGLVLGRCQHRLSRRSPGLFNALRGLLGTGATGLGVFWLLAA